MDLKEEKEKVAHESAPVCLCTDGRLFARDGEGVGRYSRELHAAMRAIDPDLLVIHDAVSVAPRAKTELERLRRWTEARIAPGTIRLREREPGTLSARDVFRRSHSHFKRRGTLLRLRAPGVATGIVHWSYPMPVHLVGWRNVYTIHDVIPLDRPDLTTIDAARHVRLLRAIETQASAIATVTEAVRKDIVRLLGIAPERVFDLGQSVDDVAADDALPVGLLAGGYFLFSGGDNPRKNGERTVAAWRRSGAVRPLVITGAGTRWADEPGIVRLPFQSDSRLRALTAGARALLFPSLGEGFGRPIAEAMALGTAVLTARGHATEEVAGGVASLVDPLDIDSMAAAIAALDGDDALVAGLVAAGLRRAPAFGRDVFARRLAEFYQGLATA
jgi:glycosyltransferase involved in cell wall biosynthesis